MDEEIQVALSVESLEPRAAIWVTGDVGGRCTLPGGLAHGGARPAEVALRALFEATGWSFVCPTRGGVPRWERSELKTADELEAHLMGHGAWWAVEEVDAVTELAARPDADEPDRMLIVRLSVGPEVAAHLGMTPLSELLEGWSRGTYRLDRLVIAALRAWEPGGVALGPLPAHPGFHIVHPALGYLPLKTPTLPPATHTNALLVGAGEALFVEPASADEGEIDRVVGLHEAAIAAGLSPRAIVLTHHHHDHVGGAMALRARLGLPLWAHPLTAALLPGVHIDRELEDGEVIELDGAPPTVWRIVHTPGHAPGHICLLEENSRLMIAGDMVAGKGTILVEPQDGDMEAYLASLQQMAGYEPSVLIPAHGGPIDDAVSRLEHYHAHRLRREAKVLGALSNLGRAATASELVPQAYDDAPKSVWPLAALSVEAHLIKLVRDGVVRRDGGGWAL